MFCKESRRAFFLFFNNNNNSVEQVSHPWAANWEKKLFMIYVKSFSYPERIDLFLGKEYDEILNRSLLHLLKFFLTVAGILGVLGTIEHNYFKK